MCGLSHSSSVASRDVRQKPSAKYCVVSFPSDYSGDFRSFIASNDPDTCCACVFEADGGTPRGGEHCAITGEPKGKGCLDSCWCTELEGAGTVDEKGRKVGVVWCGAWWTNPMQA